MMAQIGSVWVVTLLAATGACVKLCALSWCQGGSVALGFTAVLTFMTRIGPQRLLASFISRLRFGNARLFVYRPA